MTDDFINDFTETQKLFSKEQILKSERFQKRKDVLNALLSSEKYYSIEDAEQMVENYMKGKVK